MFVFILCQFRVALSTTHEDVSCNNGINGSITVSRINNGHEPYSYNWSNNQTGETAINLAAWNYMVTVTDDLKLDRPVFEVMRILGSSLLVQDSLSELFKQNDAKVLEDGQLELDFLC